MRCGGKVRRHQTCDLAPNSHRMRLQRLSATRYLLHVSFCVKFPFALSVSKSVYCQFAPFDRLRANGGTFAKRDTIALACVFLRQIPVRSERVEERMLSVRALRPAQGERWDFCKRFTEKNRLKTLLRGLLPARSFEWLTRRTIAPARRSVANSP